MGKVSLRSAKRSDGADLAILDNIAGHGISAWFWQGAVNMGKAEDAYDWGRERFMDEDAPFAWKNSVVAEVDGIIAGAANGYVMQPPEPDYEKNNPEQIIPVMELFSLVAGYWLVDSLAVYSKYRGEGIGARLLDNCFERARNAACNCISLVAEDSNMSALKLYQSRGFVEKDQRPYIPFSENSKTQNWLLFTAPLN